LYPVILPVEAVQDRLIWDAEIAVAVKPAGTDGGVDVLLTATVMAELVVEFPAASLAMARMV
jgi:hypothetical protein